MASSRYAQVVALGQLWLITAASCPVTCCACFCALQVLPGRLRGGLLQHPRRGDLLEVSLQHTVPAARCHCLPSTTQYFSRIHVAQIVLDLGRRPEVRFLGHDGGEALEQAQACMYSDNCCCSYQQSHSLASCAAHLSPVVIECRPYWVLDAYTLKGAPFFADIPVLQIIVGHVGRLASRRGCGRRLRQ